jgi:uncharacterized coiled-coil protein SlyX
VPALTCPVCPGSAAARLIPTSRRQFAEQSELIESLTTALAKVKREKAKLAESVPLAAVVDKQPTREERTMQELEKSVREQERIIKDQRKTSQCPKQRRWKRAER